MNSFNLLGKMLIVAGLMLIVTGIIFVLGAKISHLGRLPGDIYIQRKGFSFYFPITTAILISIFLSLIFWMFNKLK